MFLGYKGCSSNMYLQDEVLHMSLLPPPPVLELVAHLLQTAHVLPIVGQSPLCSTLHLPPDAFAVFIPL